MWWGTLAGTPVRLSLPLHVVTASLTVCLKCTDGTLYKGKAHHWVSSPQVWLLEHRVMIIPFLDPRSGTSVDKHLLNVLVKVCLSHTEVVPSPFLWGLPGLSSTELF